jgi:hypothetical protein
MRMRPNIQPLKRRNAAMTQRASQLTTSDDPPSLPMGGYESVGEDRMTYEMAKEMFSILNSLHKKIDVIDAALGPMDDRTRETHKRLIEVEKMITKITPAMQAEIRSVENSISLLTEELIRQGLKIESQDRTVNEAAATAAEAAHEGQKALRLVASVQSDAAQVRAKLTSESEIREARDREHDARHNLQSLRIRNVSERAQAGATSTDAAKVGGFVLLAPLLEMLTRVVANDSIAARIAAFVSAHPHVLTLVLGLLVVTSAASYLDARLSDVQKSKMPVWSQALLAGLSRFGYTFGPAAEKIIEKASPEAAARLAAAEKILSPREGKDPSP